MTKSDNSLTLHYQSLVDGVTRSTALASQANPLNPRPWESLGRKLRPLRWRRWSLDQGRGNAVSAAWALDRADQLNPFWWPQGLTHLDGNRFIGTAYAKDARRRNQGSRLTLFDVGADGPCYDHVLLQRGDGQPLRIHAGGVAIIGRQVFLAATHGGLFVAELGEIEPMAPHRRYGVTYRWCLRVHAQWKPAQPDFRFSFCEPHGDAAIVVGEYGALGQGTRLGVISLPPSGDETTALELRPLELPRIQGVVETPEGTYLSQSNGRRRPGSLWAHPPGRIDAVKWREWGGALPAGTEDLTWTDGHLWSVTEHPRRRWLYAVDEGGLRGR